ncbi:hypothetical protein DNTS_014598 [Danionella cerebrum]|uniref:Uncharacterized protein n=1 Tax=Danionella cerebrum TaxID=2873325 RepID=A0A553Q7B0_9TELE|nr:hypothetical protein DNTS_014598 [Danionella translucida]
MSPIHNVVEVAVYVRQGTFLGLECDLQVVEITLEMKVGQKNSVCILSSRERGQGSCSQRILQKFVEEKTRRMKWQSQKVDLPDNPFSTFLLAFSPDRSLMASTHVNHNIYITEVTTGKCVRSLVGHRRTPWCLTFHPCVPGLLASGCLDGEVRIWDLHLLLIATNNELHLWDWSRKEPFLVVKTASAAERLDDDPEIPMDSVEMPHLRQRSFLQAQPVRHTPVLLNSLNILSTRNSIPQAGGTPAAVSNVCSRCSSAQAPSSPEEDPSDSHASTFSSARTEPPHIPRFHAEARAANRQTYGGGNMRNHSSSSGRRVVPGMAPAPHFRLARTSGGHLPGGDWLGTALHAQGMNPSIGSTYSRGTNSAVQSPGTSAESPVYPSTSGSSSRASSSRHHPPDEGHSSSSSIDRDLMAQEPHNYHQTQELFNNNMDPHRPGPSHHQPLYSRENPSHSLMNRCRVCHNLFTHNGWRRASQSTTVENNPTWQPASSALNNMAPVPLLEHGPTPETQEAFTHRPVPNQQNDQTVDLFNQEAGLLERVYRVHIYRQVSTRFSRTRPEALHQEMPDDSPDHDYLRRLVHHAQRMIQYQSRRDGVRQHSLHVPSRRRPLSLNPGSLSPGSSAATENNEVDIEEFEDNGSRRRVPHTARMSAPFFGRFMPRSLHLPELLPYTGVFHERGQPVLATHSSVNMVLAGAVIGDGQLAVANNIANTTYRLQWWDFTNFDLPEISNGYTCTKTCLMPLQISPSPQD